MYFITSFLISILLSAISIIIGYGHLTVLIFLLSMIYSNLIAILENSLIKLLLLISFLLIMIFNNHFYIVSVTLVFSIMYRIKYLKKHKNQVFITTLVIIFYSIYIVHNYGVLQNISYISVLALIGFLGHYMSEDLKNKTYLNILKDSKAASTIEFKNKIKILEQKKILNINNEILSERNRIAREIHDNVGHRITSAIFKTGALISMEKDENSQRWYFLNSLNTNLKEAMQDIKKSVYSIHDKVGKLKIFLVAMLNNYDFCKVNLNMDFDDIKSNQQKLFIIGIIKEALSNTSKHSDADSIQITITKQFENIRILIVDNGKKFSKPSKTSTTSHLGLKAMKEEVEKDGGTIKYGFNNGFRIFVKLKEKTDESNEYNNN